MTTNYGYDNIYELQSATQSGTTTESYTYDPVGNRLTSLGVANYTNNTSNELTSTSNATYTYDYNGNTLTKSDSTGTTNYAWDYENRLTSVTLPGSGGTVSFKYDPFGRRIYKSSGSGTSIFAYDGDNIVEETNSSGTAVARYSQGLNIDEPLAMLRSSTTSFYQADGLGTITSLANSVGSLAQTYTFDSFGKQTASSGSLTNSFRYTAREFDTETSLYYYRARYYDPTIGGFTREDPLRFGAGSPNFYGYVYQSPINFTDPSGRVVLHGNWCGPNWTGGKKEPFDPRHFKDYKNPIDGLDESCMHHDICYFNCRSTIPCDKGARRKCMRQCDKLLLAEAPTSNGWLGPSGDEFMIWYGILLHFYPNPGSNESCGCKDKGK